MTKERPRSTSSSKGSETMDASLFYQFAVQHFISASEFLQKEPSLEVFQNLTGEIFNSDSSEQKFKEGALLTLFNYLLRLESLRLAKKESWIGCDLIEVIKFTGKAIYLSGVCHYEFLLQQNSSLTHRRYALLKKLISKTGLLLLLSGQFLQKDENVVYFLVRKYSSLTKAIGEKAMNEVSHIFFPSGKHQAGQMLRERYQQRNFSYLLAEIDDAINGIS